MKAVLVNDREEFRIVRVSCVVQRLSKDVVSHVLLDLLGVFHCLIASVLVSGEQDQVSDLIPGGFEILVVGEAVLVVLVLVRKDNPCGK